MPRFAITHTCTCFLAADLQGERLRDAEHRRLVRVASRTGESERAVFRFFARFAPTFSTRTAVPSEALSAACALARGWVSLSLDGEIADPEQALLVDHLEDCAACSSFQARSAASTAMLRSALSARPERAFDLSQLVRLTRSVNGMAAESAGVVGCQDTHKSGEVIVRFWDGGPLGVPANALARLPAPRMAA